jgi:hypothetical protein
MKASLGVEKVPRTPAQANFIGQGYADPATEVVKLSSIATPVGAVQEDGTQIWRITHNGVDTHPIHFHLFHVQLINRVGWDGAYRLPDANELGWKDTVRISPLEDTYVALRPIAPLPATLPFKIPNSFRPLEPALPTGSPLGFSNRDPLGNPISPGVTNDLYNFGWEYVWHCHILSHEENDMMRAVVFTAPPEAPTSLVAGTRTASGVPLQWKDNSMSATAFVVQRATDANFTTGVTDFTLPVLQCPLQAGCPRTYVDAAAVPATSYYYRVFATNTVGSTVPNYPTITTDSAVSNVVQVAGLAGDVVIAPANLVAAITLATRVTLTWTDMSTNENQFQVFRSSNGGAFSQVGTVSRSAAQRLATGGTVTFNNTGLVSGVTYNYYVIARKTTPPPISLSAPSPNVSIFFGAPTAPSGLTGAGYLIPGNNSSDVIALSWVDTSNNETGFQVQRCQGTCAANGNFATVATLPANETTFTETRSKTFDWTYRVRATNPVGSSAYTAPVIVTTP